MKACTGFFAIIMMSAFTATGAQAAFVENEYDCEMSMGESIDCAENAVKVEKKRLNRIYTNVHRTLSVKQKSQLDKEQAAWLKQRNKECEFKQEGSMNNMAVWGMVSADICTANETQKRSKVLAKKYNIK